MTLRAALWLTALAACSRPPDEPPPSPASPPRAAPRPDAATASRPPEHLASMAQSGEVQTRGPRGEIVPAREADNAVLRAYPRWPSYGAATGEPPARLSIMTAKSDYASGEAIRVVHVHEVLAPGAMLCVMGPKDVFGEYVDGVLRSAAADVPPAPYDGRVVASPAEDHNYDVTEYRLPPGDHTITWWSSTPCSPAKLRSNTLSIRVR